LPLLWRVKIYLKKRKGKRGIETRENVWQTIRKRKISDALHYSGNMKSSV
jgi:ADP-heptose:LPS heptosyltransferase